MATNGRVRGVEGDVGGREKEDERSREQVRLRGTDWYSERDSVRGMEELGERQCKRDAGIRRETV
jgi:hypothetical protein